METESESYIPFLDFDIYRRRDGSLRHKVYRKPTHINLYLNAKSHHHPSNKQAVLSTLIHRARALCDEDNLQADLVFLKGVFRENGYSDRQIHRTLNRRPLLPQPDNTPHSVAFLPFVGTVFNRIRRVLARHNIKSVGLPHTKLSSLLRPVKDHFGLRTPGVYRIPCECGRVYIGQTGRSVDIRLKEHQRHIRLEHLDKSAVAEHSIDQGHRIQFHNASILATKT
jgi:transposase